MAIDNLKQLVGNYSNFDDYFNSGQFEKLSQADMVLVYEHFKKLGKLEAHVRRTELHLDSRRTLDDEPLEDLRIIQPDGSRACVNWELDPRGFQITD